jgi:pimeloyl-ACP methyl ester carboxylesterase
LHYVEAGDSDAPLIVCCTASRSSGSVGGYRSGRSRRRVFGSSPIRAATTCHPSQPYTDQEIERYVEAWSQSGAAAGMINYYRAPVRQSQKQAVAKLRPISAPTPVIWGERDSYLGSDLAEPDRDDVPNLDRVERLTDGLHWVHHDEAERVNQLLIDFFGPDA